MISTLDLIWNFFSTQLQFYWLLFVHSHQHSLKKSIVVMNSSEFHVARAVVKTFSSAWLADVSTFRAMTDRFSMRIVSCAVMVMLILACSTFLKFPETPVTTNSSGSIPIPIQTIALTFSFAWITTSFVSVVTLNTSLTATTPWDAFPEIRLLAVRRHQCPFWTLHKIIS